MTALGFPPSTRSASQRRDRSPSPVLIGDDNDSFRELLAEVFEEAGFRVHEVGSGQEVVAVAEREAPILLLLDVRMPRLSGLEAYRQLRDQLQVVAPAIFMTSGPTAEIRQQARSLGALALLDKLEVRLDLLRQLVLLLQQTSEGDLRSLRRWLLDAAFPLGLLGSLGAPGSPPAHGTSHDPQRPAGSEQEDPTDDQDVPPPPR